MTMYRLRLEIDAPDTATLASMARRVAQDITHGTLAAAVSMGSDEFQITYEYEVEEIEEGR